MTTDKPTFVYVTYIRSTPQRVWHALTDATSPPNTGATAMFATGSRLALGTPTHRRLEHRGRRRHSARINAPDAARHDLRRTRRAADGGESTVTFDIAPYHDIVD